MKDYDLIVIGTGSAANLIDPMIDRKPGLKVALIDKDEPGGICLTRGCIPSKMLLYPAELVRLMDSAAKLGLDVELRKVDFSRVMERMRTEISREIEEIRSGLKANRGLDYYPQAAEFIAPYTLKAGRETLKGKMILLGTGSKPSIPPVRGLNDGGYLTSDTVLKLTDLPESIVIIGGGYIAAEYGHFFSAMGSRVTIIGRNPRFLPDEEPEISAVARMEMARHMTILTNHEVLEVRKAGEGKRVIARERGKAGEREVPAAEVLVAAGRSPQTDILHPEKSNIRTYGNGWILVNEYLETSQPQIYALGDANGKFPFKHKANYESTVLYHNLVLQEKVKADYHAVPHAVFCHPEVAAVGLGEAEARERLGEENILLGLQKYEDTAKGLAMGARDYFAKVIVERRSNRLLGAHIVGPQASILIQEVVTLMYTPERGAGPITRGMHIHPALTEVVERAFYNLMPPAHYRHVLAESLSPVPPAA